MNLIMLDIDGVLNSTHYWWRSGGDLPMGQAGAIDPAAVARLNQIVDQTNAYVVISSSWRTQGQERVETYLKARGFTGEVIGCTPVKWGCPRCAEIEDYLWRFPFSDLRVAIIDDDEDAWHEDGIPNAKYFPTNFQVGLTDAHVPLIADWLNATPSSSQSPDSAPDRP